MDRAWKAENALRQALLSFLHATESAHKSEFTAGERVLFNMRTDTVYRPTCHVWQAFRMMLRTRVHGRQALL
ncbi:hypothetical protein [Streptomyces sp. NPDC048277]|uniref:hypothetical protein n=1 Tax=Streptomyces sp. NPDC048277 TaxID=3155027 RepID=UPI0033EAD608